MFFVCQSMRPLFSRGGVNQTTFDTRSPTAIRDIRRFRPRRKQIPETSRSGTSTTRLTRSGFLFALPFLGMGEALWRVCVTPPRGGHDTALYRLKLACSFTFALGHKRTLALLRYSRTKNSNCVGP